jgi:hypothetical protein
MTKEELAKHHHERFFDDLGRANEAAIKSGEGALKALLIINSGAVVAMLAFLDGFIDQHMRQLSAFAGSLSLFALGVVFAASGYLLAYITNYLQTRLLASSELKWDWPYVDDGLKTSAWKIWTVIFHVLAVFVGISSLILFVCGVFSVRGALVNIS